MNVQPSIIDTHVHFFDKRQTEWDLEWSWLAPNSDHPILGNIDPIKSQSFDLTAIEGESRFAGVSGFVHVQAAIGSPDPVTETQWLEQMVKSSPIPVQIVGHVDLATPEGPNQIARHLEASSRFVGVRDFSLEPALAAGDTSAYADSFRLMVDEKLVLDLDCEYPNMPAALGLANQYPDMNIVLEHIGFPRSRDDKYFSDWSQGIVTLAQAPNVMCKISGLGMTDPRFTADSLKRWMQVCLDAFGPDRLVIGSNWPIDRLYSSYDAIIEVYRDFFSPLTFAEQEKIFNLNTKRVYRFND